MMDEFSSKIMEMLEDQKNVPLMKNLINDIENILSSSYNNDDKVEMIQSKVHNYKVLTEVLLEDDEDE